MPFLKLMNMHTVQPFTIRPYDKSIMITIMVIRPVLCPSDQHFSAMSGLLKRKFEEVEEDPCYSSSSPSSLSSSAYSGWDSDGESCYSDTLDSTPSNPSSPAASLSSEYGFRFLLSLSSFRFKKKRRKKCSTLVGRALWEWTAQPYLGTSLPF